MGCAEGAQGRARSTTKTTDRRRCSAAWLPRPHNTLKCKRRSNASCSPRRRCGKSGQAQVVEVWQRRSREEAGRFVPDWFRKGVGASAEWPLVLVRHVPWTEYFSGFDFIDFTAPALYHRASGLQIVMIHTLSEVDKPAAVGTAAMSSLFRACRRHFQEQEAGRQRWFVACLIPTNSDEVRLQC